MEINAGGASLMIGFLIFFQVATTVVRATEDVLAEDRLRPLEERRHFRVGGRGYKTTENGSIGFSFTIYSGHEIVTTDH